jgi:hypothetical protein
LEVPTELLQRPIIIVIIWFWLIKRLVFVAWISHTTFFIPMLIIVVKVTVVKISIVKGVRIMKKCTFALLEIPTGVAKLAGSASVLGRYHLQIMLIIINK